MIAAFRGRIAFAAILSAGLVPASQAQAPKVSTPGSAQVVLYEEDPANPNGKRFVGSAVWRTETVTPGPGQAPELAIRADMEVPERKLAMTWSLRRNTDTGLPATHTVEIMFKLPADFPAGGISNVPGILMKQGEQTRGVPLAGLAVKITPGFHLIGLSNLDSDKQRNLALLKERGWFDIPLVYNNNRRAILSFEKGSLGERAFKLAFGSWVEKPKASTKPPKGTSGTSAGSGFFITQAGHVLTNFHVVQDCASISLKMHDGERFFGVRLIASDDSDDLAIIKVDKKVDKLLR